MEEKHPPTPIPPCELNFATVNSSAKWLKGEHSSSLFSLSNGSSHHIKNRGEAKTPALSGPRYYKQNQNLSGQGGAICNSPAEKLEE